MKRIATLTAALAAGGLVMSHGALAQMGGGGQEFGVHGGYLWGDTAVGGPADPQPELSNGWVLGLSWGMNWDAMNGWELRYTYADTDLDDTPAGSISMPLHLFDANYVMHFPMGGMVGTRTAPTAGAAAAPRWYLTAGLGWAIARLDNTFDVNAQTVDGDNGFTVNAGGGLKWPLQEGHAIRWDLRYRYLDQVVDAFDESLNTWETTIGYSIRF